MLAKLYARKSKQYNKEFSTLIYLRNEKNVTPAFMAILQNLTLEELIALKFESILRNFSNRWVGFPLYKFSKQIIDDAMLMAALRISPTIRSAEYLLGDQHKKTRKRMPLAVVELKRRMDKKEINKKWVDLVHKD